MALPDIAVITNCGPEHLEFLGDLMGVRKENACIIAGLNPKGALIVNGLPAEDAERLKVKWTLGNNAVFDQSYIEDFNHNALRDFVRSLTQKSGGNLRPNVEIEMKPNHQKQTVDVVITFK